MPEKITAADRRKLAAFRAGLILASVMDNGWWPEDLERRYGTATVEALSADITEIAAGLIKKSGRRPAG